MGTVAKALSSSRGRGIALAVAVLLLPIVAIGLFLALPSGAAAALLRPVLGIVDRAPDLPEDLDGPAERSVVLASDGSELATLSGVENRVTVELAAIPEHVRHAVLAIEDADFYDHPGIDHRALVRAAWVNLRRGDVVQGGSTITQQYIKNAVLSTDRTAERKTTELRYALELERRLPKDDILEDYLNIAYFGEGVYGIATAADFYFSKEPRNLTVGEAAVLAGLINRPEAANPVADEEAATQRRDVVIERMAEEGFLTEEERQAAAAESLVLDLNPLPPPENPFFVAYVRHQLFEDEALGATREARQDAVYTGGLVIHTTLDPALQSAAEGAIADVLTDPLADPLGALISVEPPTGAIRALAVGPKTFGTCAEGEDACASTEVHPAVPGLGGSGRQPGSAFKPVVLAAALDAGFPPGWQEETAQGEPVEGCEDGGEPWAPGNYSPEDGGIKDMDAALTVSNNVYHAELMGRLQPPPVVAMAERLGISVENLPEQCSLALGSGSVFPLDLVVAYATIANGGSRCTPYVIERVEEGDAILLEHEQACEEALAPEVALRLTDLLRGPVEEGTATAAQLGRPVAGKTGTTDDFHDAWFVGFVPQLATAAWVGFEQPRPMEGILGVERVTGGNVPAQLWAAYMNAAVEDLEPAEFAEPPPPDVITVPEALDRPLEEVTAGLGEHDLHVIETAVADYRPPGTVVTQDPAPGTEVPRGHFLTLGVSDGTGEPPPLPVVIGLPEAEARAVLEDAGYLVSVTVQELELDSLEDLAAADPPDGSVVEQEPPDGAPLLPGETASITIVRYTVEQTEPPSDPADPDNGLEIPEPPAAEPPAAPGDADGVVVNQVRPHERPEREYVVLRNVGDGPVDVSGWSLQIAGGERLGIGEGYAIAPRGRLRVYTGMGEDRGDRFHNQRDTAVLPPGGAEIILQDAAGTEVGRFAY